MINKENSFELNFIQNKDAGKYTFAFISLFIFLILIYANSFHCEFQFDDFLNIVKNKDVHLSSPTWQNLKKAIFPTTHATAISPGIPSRPLSYLSFALNYSIGGLDPFGYHVVNFIIHYVTAVFLFLFIFKILNLPLNVEQYGQTSYSIALLATFFWATSPLQVNAVTYIVQRMTSMAGMFYIMSMYFYINGRTTKAARNKVFLFTATFLSALLAVSTKENAVMIPVSIYLLDLFLIQGVDDRAKHLRIIILLLCLSALVAAYAVLQTSLADFHSWAFSLRERLLTEPRVFLYYISLLLYPMGSRLAVDHDFDVSHSLFTPWTTWVSILLIFLMIGFALFGHRRFRVISFCIIFFFLNHLVEGTIIPLDLVFEHRNYIPSMLFFIPISIFVISVIDYFAYTKAFQFAVSFIVIFLLVAQGHSVILRNTVFSYAKLLWLDNVEKTPDLSRPHANLGIVYNEEGNYKMAQEEMEKSLQLARFPNQIQPAYYHYNLGSYYLLLEKDLDKALSHLQETARLSGGRVGHDRLSILMLKKGNLTSAYEHIRTAISQKPDDASLVYELALIHIKAGNIDEAIKAAWKAYLLEDNFYKPFSVIATVYKLRGDYDRSIRFWESYLSSEPSNVNALLAVVELYYLTGQRELLIQAVGRLIVLSRGKELGDFIESANDYYFPYCVDKKVLMPIVKEVFEELASVK